MNKSVSVLEFFISSIVFSLDVVIESLQFSSLLLHHCSHHIYNGNHTNYFPIYNRNMPDMILCKKRVTFNLIPYKLCGNKINRRKTYANGRIILTCHYSHCLKNVGVRGYRYQVILFASNLIIHSENIRLGC